MATERGSDAGVKGGGLEGSTSISGAWGSYLGGRWRRRSAERVQRREPMAARAAHRGCSAAVRGKLRCVGEKLGGAQEILPPRGIAVGLAECTHGDVGRDGDRNGEDGVSGASCGHKTKLAWGKWRGGLGTLPDTFEWWRGASGRPAWQGETWAVRRPTRLGLGCLIEEGGKEGEVRELGAAQGGLL